MLHRYFNTALNCKRQFGVAPSHSQHCEMQIILGNTTGSGAASVTGFTVYLLELISERYRSHASTQDVYRSHASTQDVYRSHASTQDVYRSDVKRVSGNRTATYSRLRYTKGKSAGFLKSRQVSRPRDR